MTHLSNPHGAKDSLGHIMSQDTDVAIMAIVNVTPDSFSDGGRLTKDTLFPYIETCIKDGATIIDIGAESSRPGAAPVSVEEELERLHPILENYTKYFDVPLSIDTTKPDVARIALEAGATIVNDISGLDHPDMPAIVARHQAAAVIMHKQGLPQTMQKDPKYNHVVQDVKQYLSDKIQVAKDHGIQHIIIDPGIGFGKTLPHNLALLNHLDAFQDLGVPILIGTSNKSFIGDITGQPISDRLEGTLISNIMAVAKGARIVRVHNVKAMKHALDVYAAIINSR